MSLVPALLAPKLESPLGCTVRPSDLDFPICVFDLRYTHVWQHVTFKFDDDAVSGGFIILIFGHSFIQIL